LSWRHALLGLRSWGLILCLAMPPSGGVGEAQAQADPWSALKRPGHIAFMRHSDAPGAPGDPTGFRLDDCATQRNLSEEGRAQARRTAAALKRNEVVFDEALTSPWCRCRETALLVTGKEATVLDALSNLVGRQEYRASQLTALKDYLAKLDRSSRVLFVSHGILIAALFGISPAQGEILVVRLGEGGEPVVAARLLID
jgi:broad specificity phosphatase PhoE